MREREIEERERKLGALMAEKGSLSLKKKTSKVCCTPLQCRLGINFQRLSGMSRVSIADDSTINEAMRMPIMLSKV